MFVGRVSGFLEMFIYIKINNTVPSRVEYLRRFVRSHRRNNNND